MVFSEAVDLSRHAESVGIDFAIAINPYFPINYTALADSGDVDAAWELQATLDGERRAFQRWMRDRWLAQGQGAIPIAELKAWLGLMGLPQGPVRPPLVPLSDQELDELRADLDRLNLLDAVSSAA